MSRSKPDTRVHDALRRIGPLPVLGGTVSRIRELADDPPAATDFGVAYATLQCADLLANGAPGIHFYTLNRSPATRAILSALRTLSPWEAQPGLSMSSA